MTIAVATPPNPSKGNNAPAKPVKRRTSVFKTLFIIVLLVMAFMAGAYMQSTDSKIAATATSAVNRGLEKIDEMQSGSEEVAPTPTPAPQPTPVVPDQQ